MRMAEARGIVLAKHPAAREVFDDEWRIAIAEAVQPCGSALVEIGRGSCKSRAWISAANGIRWGERPMSAADAKEFVRSKYPKASWGLLVNRASGQRWVYIWDGVGVGDAIWGKGDTLGQAWKAAAEAIKAEG